MITRSRKTFGGRFPTTVSSATTGIRGTASPKESIASDHGPGQAHVTAASSGTSRPAQIRAAIVNPARLDRERQLDTCMQCHLETTSLRLPNAIRNYTRPPFSDVPGERLSEYEQFFDHAPGTGFGARFEVAHQA